MSTPVEGGLRDALSGQYEIEREIGRGGMGVVYLARDVRLDRPVAIKLLSPDQNDEPAAHERFLREARTAASLSHPNIVSIYREDEINGRTFFVMQYVNGASLGERVRDLGPVPPVAATRWLRDVALALGYAHSLGVIHRDIKPENILIDGVSQKAMVADFGIARVAQASRLTSTDQVLGSVHFMSPEQITNEPLDGRGDLYSLGAVAFFALSGVLPFPSSAAGAVLVAHVTSPPPPLLSVAPNTPRALAAVVDRCLRKDPGQRYQTGEELAGALEAATVEDFDPDSAIIAESDAARLWKRASELQADAAKRGAISGDVPLNSVPLLRRRLAADGYRLSDAKAAAVEAGISAQYVALALDEIRASPPVAQSAPASTATERSHSRIAGAPMQIEREVTVDREVASDEFEFLVDTIQRSFGDIGQVSTLGRSLLWSSQGQQRKLQVSVVPRHGRTTIRITEKLSPLAGGLFGGIGGGVGGGVGGPAIALGVNVLHSVPLGIAGFVGAAGLAYTLARTIFVSVARRRTRTIDQLIVVLRSQAEQPVVR